MKRIGNCCKNMRVISKKL